ncbi:MAG: glyceraldehyde-3-phosphate dehydrogenase [Candidatus Entotheonella gemina]|uniref:Glyceraldehyde-3-phosphate dehydrogenase n=1 Tax=Candidatus Entotheonella gemina TaxID=1429439 RepID=W4MAG2_9BACT|nr:MAG: glyceraldehyde-3-phosphate dehydrogenase [Candidatus Entotheonella gemina]
MSYRIGINGFGRIGRMVLRRSLTVPEVDVVAVNDLADIGDLAYLLKYDSVHGVFPGEVGHDASSLQVGGQTISFFSECSPADIPWDGADVDVVIDATGAFRSREAASRHLRGRVRKVLISAPSDNVDVTIVPGVNDAQYDPEHHQVISMASCTTNSLAPVAKVLQDHFGIVHLFITTVHAYTASQSIMDKPTRKRRRGRAGALSMIPTSTGAAQATAQVIPELAGKMDGMAIRVPIPDGSVTDIVAELATPTRADAINDCLREAAQKPPLKGIMAYSEEELVSIDIVGNPHSSIVDAPSTRVLNGTMAKLLAWYDNEWGYACRLTEFAGRLIER